MPVLSNQRHELFAQGIAKGKTLVVAYEEAGYKPNDSASARLYGDVRIRGRVEELKERAAKRTEITIADLTNRLLRLSDKGEALGDAPGFSVSRAAAMDVAKLNGLIVDKAVVDSKNEVTVIERKVID